ncbi:hypothetical protein HII36_01575 [Nonomuraea sp. NN258]|uniref:YciI family protein n=1 Tax=Nonomuraea antri TaxID=2730852 RepID=UPI00156A5428|nr:YciI family protein [Nonomuraea antri]NRQ30536.1 hypothetical protein [Nonomuraea antri]
MKYMIMLYASQQDYDVLAGRPVPGKTPWSAEDVAAMHAGMQKWNQGLVESGEFVDTQGLSAPAHTKRLQLRDGVPVITDGPYPETQEVLAGYTIVECESYDRAVELAMRIGETQHPAGAELDSAFYVDIRPVVGGAGDLD